MSKQELLSDARMQNYKPEILEKVYRLLDVFQQFTTVPYLKDRLVLKGGTALNLFCFDSIRRLSVDIDLNYIGSVNKRTMLDERIILNDTISTVLQSNGFDKYRAPNHHAGGKLIWLYDSVLGSKGTLEIDINYMFRMPLWPIAHRATKVSGYENWSAPVLDIHELAAGKLSALFDRRVSRDLYDAHYLLNHVQFDIEKLQIAFAVYIAMTKINLNDLNPNFIQCDLRDMKNRLLPVLCQKDLPRIPAKLQKWSEELLKELRKGLEVLLPLQEHHIEFINQVRNFGVIKPGLITTESGLQEKIALQPGLLWAIKCAKNISVK